MIKMLVSMFEPLSSDQITSMDHSSLPLFNLSRIKFDHVESIAYIYDMKSAC